MRRSLISFDAFKSITSNSLSAAQQELIGATPVLEKALNENELKLNSFGVDTVLYEASDGSYVHANFGFKDGQLLFDNIEKLVIDESSERTQTRNLLSKMLEAVIENNKSQADVLFDKYIQSSVVRRKLNESKLAAAPKAKKKKKGKKGCCKMPTKMNKLREWHYAASGVRGFIENKYYTKVLGESFVGRDDRGNVAQIAIPTSRLRNEAALKKFTWNTLPTNSKVLRKKASGPLSENKKFWRKVLEVSRLNNLADNNGVQESLDSIVTGHPEVLFLTQNELSETIKNVFIRSKVTNFDDHTCDFIAEGILRTAQEAYTDRVHNIIKQAGFDKFNEDEHDTYHVFQKAANIYFPRLDEVATQEMQVYVELYEAIRDVFGHAKHQNNRLVMAEASQHLGSLASIITLRKLPNLNIAYNAAEWLEGLVETNLGSSEWDVSNGVHQTVSGDHPAMSQKAKHGYTPASDFSGDWGDPAPVSDGKSYKGNSAEMRHSGWGNEGGNETYPSLSNPHVPSPFGDYKIKGEKHIDSDGNLLGQWDSGDTWPELNNPYIPSGVSQDELVVKEDFEPMGIGKPPHRMRPGETWKSGTPSEPEKYSSPSPGGKPLPSGFSGSSSKWVIRSARGQIVGDEYDSKEAAEADCDAGDTVELSKGGNQALPSAPRRPW